MVHRLMQGHDISQLSSQHEYKVHVLCRLCRKHLIADLLLILGRKLVVIQCGFAGAASAASSASAATTCAELGHPGLVLFGETITISPVFALSIRLDGGIMAVGAGDLPLFVLVAVARGAASETFAGEPLVWGLRSAG